MVGIDEFTPVRTFGTGRAPRRKTHTVSAIAREYIGGAQRGFEAALDRGPMGDFEVVGVQVILQDGSYREVDSSDQSFMLCAREAMRKSILPHAAVVLLEPVMKLDIEVPEQFQGTVTGHVSKKRGLVTASETSDSTCVIAAEVPLAEMFAYADELRSMTQGHGSFSMEFLAYRQTPRSVQERILKDRD